MNIINAVIAIGNSDDKLTQHEWYQFCQEVNVTVRKYMNHVHANTYSLPNSMYQNAVWVFEVQGTLVGGLKHSLAQVAAEFKQDSIALILGQTEFVEAKHG